MVKTRFDDSRRKSDYLLRRVRQVLRDDEWQFILSPVGEDRRIVADFGISERTIGLCDFASNTIYVHYDVETLSTIIHECLHASYPDADEETVQAMEKLVMRNITVRQARNVFLLFSLRLIR